MIRLTHLSNSTFAADHKMAVDEHGALTWCDFCSIVGGAITAIAPGSTVVISHSNAFYFLAYLIAGCARGARVIIPPNNLSQTLHDIGVPIDRVLDQSFVPAKADSTFNLADQPLNVDFYTSGSTGAAKRISRSLHQMEVELETIDDLWGARVTGSTTFSTIPHYHVYNLIFGLLWPLVSGRPFVIRRFELWEELIGALKPNATIITSPSHLSRMGGLSPLPTELMPSLVLTAGAPLDDRSAVDAAAILQRPVDEIYGSTETGAVAARCRNAPDPKWRPLRNYALTASADGLLTMHAPAIIAGEGLQLQDLVQFFDDGSFRLLGRADRVAKMEGKRVDLGDIEVKLCAHEFIREAAVLVIEDSRPLLAAAVTLTPEARRELEAKGKYQFTKELRTFLAQSLDAGAIPRRWRYVDVLPVSALGKRAGEVRRLFEGQRDE